VALALVSTLTAAQAEHVDVRPGVVAVEPHHDANDHSQGHGDGHGVSVIQSGHGNDHGSSGSHNDSTVRVEPGHHDGVGIGVVIGRDADHH
jgi:hypothetical protein